MRGSKAKPASARFDRFTGLPGKTACALRILASLILVDRDDLRLLGIVAGALLAGTGAEMHNAGVVLCERMTTGAGTVSHVASP